MSEEKIMTIDDFEEKYTCIDNPFTENNSFENTLFETYGDELVTVKLRRDSNPKTIWTIIDSCGWYGVVAGFHFVDRMGYLISNEEWENENEQYVIRDESLVNDWFFGLSDEERQSLFPQLKLDQLDDEWENHDVDQKEDIMNKFKTNL